MDSIFSLRCTLYGSVAIFFFFLVAMHFYFKAYQGSFALYTGHNIIHFRLTVKIEFQAYFLA